MILTRFARSCITRIRLCPSAAINNLTKKRQRRSERPRTSNTMITMIGRRIARVWFRRVRVFSQKNRGEDRKQCGRDRWTF